jgi:hypothetical protein
MYNFDTNSITGKPIKSQEADQLVSGYQQCYDELREGNVTPILHRIDNEVNDLLFAAIKANNCKFQIATAHDHRQLIAERAIQTYKYHLILVLNGTDKDFPAFLWCSLLEQVNIQINPTQVDGPTHTKAWCNRRRTDSSKLSTKCESLKTKPIQSLTLKQENR